MASTTHETIQRGWMSYTTLHAESCKYMPFKCGGTRRRDPFQHSQIHQITPTNINWTRSQTHHLMEPSLQGDGLILWLLLRARDSRGGWRDGEEGGRILAVSRRLFKRLQGLGCALHNVTLQPSARPPFEPSAHASQEEYLIATPTRGSRVRIDPIMYLISCLTTQW